MIKRILSVFLVMSIIVGLFSGVSTTSNIYTHLDFNSKVASANAIIGFFQTRI